MFESLAALVQPWAHLYANNTTLSTAVIAVHILGMFIGGGMAIGALFTMVLALAYGALTAKNLLRSLQGTAAISAMILFIIVGATTFSQILSFSGASNGLVELIGGLGLSPFAPGTVGTFGGVAIAVLLQVALPQHALVAWWIAAAVLFAFGCSTSAFVKRTFPNEDPGAFVLDEVVGYLVTVAVYASLRTMPDAVGHAAAFFAFRVFDVWKPQPARKLEDLPGAYGIMADDQMAGISAGLSMFLILPRLGW